MNLSDVRDLEKEGKLGNIAFSVGSSSIDAFAVYKLDLRVTNLETSTENIARFMHKLARQQKQQKKLITLLLQKQNKPNKRRKKI